MCAGVTRTTVSSLLSTGVSDRASDSRHRLMARLIDDGVQVTRTDREAHRASHQKALMRNGARTLAVSILTPC